MDKNKIVGLDAWRGIAAIGVFLFHFWSFFGVSGFGVFQAGHLGVDIFFVLSGFLVFLSFWRICSENFSATSVLQFAKNRFWRIFPLAFLVLLIFFPLQFFLGNASFSDFFLHLFFLQAFFESSYHSIVPVMWSLSVEIFFYASIPFLFFFVKNSPQKMKNFLILSGILAILALVFRGFLFFWFAQNDFSAFQKIFFSEQLWGRFDQFFLGFVFSAIFLSHGKISAFCEKNKHWWWLLGSILTISLSVAFVHFSSAFRDFFVGQVFFHSLFGVGIFFLLLGFLYTTEKTKKWIAPFWLQYAGIISYGIYLWHFPVLAVVSKITTNPFLGFVLSVLGTLFLSSISWHFFEKRFLKR